MRIYNIFNYARFKFSELIKWLEQVYIYFLYSGGVLTFSP